MLTPNDESLIHAGLKLLGLEIHLNAKAKGFYDKEFTDYYVQLSDGLYEKVNLTQAFKAQRIALQHSEISESLEGIRKPHQDVSCPEFTNEEIEQADALIRILDYCEAYNLKLIDAVFAKIKFNSQREYMHGGKAF